MDSSSEDNRTKEYDVFLSFRGEDIRASFISHLYSSLQNAGIIVSKDDQSLQRGDHISTSLEHAIQESRIHVVVFFKNYADSSWCMQELTQIMYFGHSYGKLPVFYDVDPSEVRHQTGEFGKSFQNLLNRISQEQESKALRWNEGSYRGDEVPLSNENLVRTWRYVLRSASGLAGFVVLNSRLVTSSLSSF